MGHYDNLRDLHDEEDSSRNRLRKQRRLESALYDVRKLTCWAPDKDWNLAEIRCIDLFTAIEDRIKSQLYDLEKQ